MTERAPLYIGTGKHNEGLVCEIVQRGPEYKGEQRWYGVVVKHWSQHDWRMRLPNSIVGARATEWEPFTEEEE